MIRTITREQLPGAVAVLAAAFHDYPVMRFVLGAPPDYDERLARLVGFFAEARLLRGDRILGLHDDAGALVAVALVTLPGDRPPPAELTERREALWRELGAAARDRYEAFSAATAPFAVEGPHHHLNMIGVRPALAGRGHARPLLDEVHRMADADPGSCGVTLSTESPRNVGLYEHVGYRLLGHARVAAELETWSFFRPARAGA